MSKNDRRQEAPANPQQDKPATLDFEGLIQAQLAPIGEFRERAESWMKEITAQVARLAGRTEDDERRKQAIDKRLADFEERMQSLLTLTELVSIDKNPFAGKAPSPPQAAPSPASPPQPAVAPANPMPAAADDDSDPDAPTAPDARPPTPPQPKSVPVTPRAQNHPNNAAAEPILLSDEDDAIQPPTPTNGPQAPARERASAVYAAPDAVARQRLTILEWSKLLAPQLERFDLGAFLGFYVESGWIDRDTAACIRNLAQQLRNADAQRETSSPLSLEEVHARSILVLSHLDAMPVGAEAASAILREARSVTQGGWLTPTT